VELPYLVLRPTGSSHLGDMGPWAWPELYRALHDTKRAFTARHGGVWSGTPLAGTIMPSLIRPSGSTASCTAASAASASPDYSLARDFLDLGGRLRC
jgi:hypothetical protein